MKSIKQKMDYIYIFFRQFWFSVRKVSTYRLTSYENEISLRSCMSFAWTFRLMRYGIPAAKNIPEKVLLAELQFCLLRRNLWALTNKEITESTFKSLFDQMFLVGPHWALDSVEWAYIKELVSVLRQMQSGQVLIPFPFFWFNRMASLLKIWSSLRQVFQIAILQQSSPNSQHSHDLFQMCCKFIDHLQPTSTNAGRKLTS